MNETIINLVKSLVAKGEHHSIEANELVTQKLVEQALAEMNVIFTKKGDLYTWD